MGRYTIVQHPETHEPEKRDPTSLYIIIGLIALILLILLIKLRNYFLGR